MRLKLKPTGKLRKVSLIVFLSIVLSLEWGSTLQGQSPISADALAAGHQSHSLLSKFTLFGDTVDPNCESSGITLNWVFCGIYDGISDSATFILTHLIEPELKTAPLCLNGTGPNCSPHDPTYAIWSNFRVYGDIFLVIALLVIVFGEAIGGGVIDSYTVKRTLPRLLAAAILINLSIYIVAFALDVGNILGGGIGSLITAPLQGAGAFTIHPNGTVATAEVGALGIIGLAFAAKGAAGALTSKAGLKALFTLKGGSVLIDGILIPAFLLFVAILATIAVRKAIILALVFVSPVAFALYALPNTEQYFKRWWKLLQEMVLVYPIIVLMFAVSDVLSVTVEAPTATTGAASAGVNLLLSFVFLIIPLFMIPFSFKLAGGVLGRIHDFVDNGRQKAHSWNEGRRERGKAKWKAADVQTRSDRYAAMQKYASTKGKPFRGLVGGMAGFYGGYNIEAEASKIRADTAKEVNDQIATGKDDEIRGLLIDKKTAERKVENGKVQYRSLGGQWVDEAAVDAGQARWGHDTFAMQAALSYEMRKADSEEDVARIRSNFGNTAKALGVSRTAAQGMWIGAAFENQNQHLEFKYRDWETGQMSADNARKFASEAYEKKGSYQMAQMHASTIESLSTAYDVAERAGDTETMDKIAAVAETFMTRYGGAAGGAGAPDDPAQQAVAAQQAQQAAAWAATMGATPVGTGAPGAAGGPVPQAEPVVQTNTPGAGHVAEKVRQLAVKTGVYRPLSRPTDIGPEDSGPTIDRQN
ncbi:MAG TPA: hypothetical protein VHB51_00830 [Candidatus Saccharimonadales bacterium]|nr:hypothetical protein [Candidatus Saccharimonadales bacterium]